MNLKNLSDDSLLQNTKEIAKNEREITLKVLHHLREVERRSLFALSYSSLFEYAVKELHYSEGSAHRRISSMRLLKEIPEIEKKVEDGSLPLSVLAQAQSFFKQEKTRTQDKLELLNSLEGKSTREVERELVCRSSEPGRLITEKLRPVSQTHTELKVLVDEDFLKCIEELRGLLAHAHPNASLKNLLEFALKHTLKDLRPKDPKSSKGQEKRQLLPALETLSEQERKSKTIPSKPSRYIPQEVRRQVWQRDKGQCSFVHNGKRCCSKFGLELDHIHPHALGGENTEANLRLRCRLHNQFAALQVFGHRKMSEYILRLK